METNKIKLSLIVDSQLPLFVREEYPLVSELLTEYYRSLESKGSSYDILQNIDQYVKVNNLTNLVEKTSTTTEVTFSDNIINVSNTEGFPQTYGIIQIGNEIILYKSKTTTSFNDCVRGFSGITDYSVGNSEDLVFTSTEIQEHLSGTEVLNLSAIFLKEFFNKVKKQFAYGFDNRELYTGIDKNLFVKQSKDFYTSKGTDRSFEILFRVLYGKDVEVVLPKKYLIEPSNAQYRVTRNFVVESIQGNIEDLLNKTIFQDQYGDISKSFGTVTDTQRTIKNGKEYYTLMIDYDFDKDIIVSGSIFGELKIHPKTVISDNVQDFSDNIVVDSTIGFPESGELIVGEGNESILISYNGKTINQFLNCSGIAESIASGTDISLNTYAYGYDSSGNEIRFRITGVIQDIELPEESFYYEKGDVAKLLTLGYNKNYLKDNNWIFNKTVKCEVKSFTSDGEFKYTIETYDDNGIYEGDIVEIEYIDLITGSRQTTIIDGSNVKLPIGSLPGKIFQIQTNGFDISSIFYVKKILSRFSNKFISDVLNVYRDFNSDELYVTSSSLPSYGVNVDEDVQDYKIILNGSFSGETLKIVNDGQSHGFLTGESIIYSPENESSPNNRFDIQSGVYFAKKESETEIKLARSRSDIRFGKFVSIGSTSVTNNTIGLTKFSKKDNIQSDIDSQRLIKLLRSPENTGEEYETKAGPTGILINGVEVLNYKSDDYIYYGTLKSIDVISPGNNYDVINPPELEVLSVSPGLPNARGYCGIEGSLQKINIIDGGFDYIDTPIVTISGGGGKGANAIVKMVDYDHFVDFNSSASNGRLNLISNIIGFSTYHKFSDGESVVYKTGGSSTISGLTTESRYYVNVIDDYRIKLHKTLNDSLVGINTIDITSYGVGNHRLESTRRKKKISSIVVTNSGSGYKSKKISVSSSGINTSNNTINVYDNPYNDGDIIFYYGGDQNISGLETGRYIVTTISKESFKLSNIGIGSTASDFYFKTKQYINFTTKGSGYHIFDYEPITVNISGKVGISTISQVDVTAKVQPIFRGKVVSTFVYDGGVGYGSSDIINYNKQPDYRLKFGTGAVIIPVVSNGRIVDVIINERGREYNSPPDLIVRGFGIGAILTPIVQNGEIVDVKIINSGIGYEQKNTTIETVSPGSGCELKFNPQIWTINKFEKLLKTSKLSTNDSVVFVGSNKEYGLQYTHLYSPRPLRKKVFSENIEEGNVKYRSDYQNDFESEKYHSPLLGWAYDGNPIYGPYGYDSPSNKKVRLIISGYLDPIDNQQNRPNKKIFPAGYFVEDYQFGNRGDLDEHNGRFCVTPEFPNGTYAYFMTLGSRQEDSGPFIGDKKPKFPYIIGNSFKSKPIDFNFDSNINQNKFDFEYSDIVRNTNPFNTLDNNSTYEYFKFSDDLSSKVKSISRGTVGSIKIISDGNNYKVGDKVVFNNEGSGGSSASAKVDFIKGKSIIGISQTSTSITDVEFYPSFSQNRVIGFSSVPHNLDNGDFIKIDSLSNYDEILENSFNVGVRSDNFILTLGVGTVGATGIVTYFYVSGLLEYPVIRENDILSINSEKVKVLNIDKVTSRIKVLREQDSTVGISHSVYSILYENPRKFFIELRDNIKNKEYEVNRELYFDPSESLGIGTVVGFGHTIIFSNPGIGLTSIIVPEKSIYLRDHGLNTGDELLYKTNGGIGVSVTQNSGLGSGFVLSDNSIVYVARISKDLVGISTVKVGIGTTGEFVGISQTSSTLFFTSPGSGSYHSFTTKFKNVSKGNVTKNTVTVSTASTHFLKKDDNIILEVLSGLSTTIKVKYSDYHRKLVVNPRDFSSIDVDENLITIDNHNYENGQKLIHTSTSPASGLEDQKIYYAVVYDRNRIRLAESYYNTIDKNYSVINITSSSFGTLSPINPKINVTKNQKVIFDLSDLSLSQPFGVGRTSSFDFDLFSDQNFSNKYFPVKSDGTSKIVKSGAIGISTESKIEFTVDDQFLNSIWYNLVPKTNLSIKNEYTVDDEVNENNKITFVNSILSGQKVVTEVTSDTFSFYNEFDYTADSYSQGEGSFRYYTNSENETGKIESLKLTSGGKNYERLPSISSVISSTGSGAILVPQSNTIGKINSLNIVDIGYDYSVDNTIRPRVKYPTILRVEPLTTIESIKIISPGLNYNTSPDLIVIDGFTNKVVDDIFLDYDIEDNSVTIIKNTKGLYNVEPKIISINNSNGIGISFMQYDNVTKNVKAYIAKEFSDPETFPFSIGDNVLIEGISIIQTTRKGYNSKNYNYSLFPVVGVQTSLGGSGAYVEYSLGNYITGSDIPGTFDPINSSGKIIAETSLPTFKTTLSKNSYIVGETIFTNTGKFAKVLKFDAANEFLTIETKDEFIVNSLIIGESSKSQAFIREIYNKESFYQINSSSVVPIGWNSEVGFLNNDLQRIQDSDYYQYFSYSLKSDVPIQQWNDVVNNLNHTLGFKKFGDLVLNTSANNNTGISTSQNEGLFSSICDVNSIVDVECVSDYDLASENSFYIDGDLTSDEVVFNTVLLQDYSNSLGNRVLLIDDISSGFDITLARTFVNSFNI